MLISAREIASRVRVHARDLVQRRQLSTVDLAHRTGYSQPHISQLLTGKRSMTIEAADALILALHLQPADVLTEEQRREIAQPLTGPQLQRPELPPIAVARRIHPRRARHNFPAPIGAAA